MLDKIEKSITELDRCVVKCKERTKTTEYDYDTKKPINEVVEEKEDIQIIEGMIDKMGLKQLVSTLKDIKDIHRAIEGEENSGEEESGVIVISDVCDDVGECDEDKSHLDSSEKAVCLSIAQRIRSLVWRCRRRREVRCPSYRGIKAGT